MKTHLDAAASGWKAGLEAKAASSAGGGPAVDLAGGVAGLKRGLEGEVAALLATANVSLHHGKVEVLVAHGMHA